MKSDLTEPGYYGERDGINWQIYRRDTRKLVGVAYTEEAAGRLAEEHANLAARLVLGLSVPPDETTAGHLHGASGTVPRVKTPVFIRGRTIVFLHYFDTPTGPILPHYSVRYGNGRLRLDLDKEFIEVWEDVEEVIG